MYYSMKLVLTVSLMTSILFFPIKATAQNTPSNDWAVMRTIPAGSPVSVKLKNGKGVEGNLLTVSDAAIKVSRNSFSQDIKREDVKSVQQVIKKSATAGTLIGLGIGAGAGAGLGAIGASNDDSGLDKIDHAATAGLAVIGAGVGAITGYLIGRRGSKRILVYESN